MLIRKKIFILVLLLIVTPAVAQNHNAAIVVQIRTASKFTPLVDAIVTLENSYYSGDRSSDGNGFVGFGLIPPGQYNLRIYKAGVADLHIDQISFDQVYMTAMAVVVRGKDAPPHWAELFSSLQACETQHPDWNCLSTQARGSLEFYRSDLKPVVVTSNPSTPIGSTNSTTTSGTPVTTTTTITVTPSNAPALAAQFVSQNIPAAIESGRTYRVSATMKNTGSQAWTEGTSFRLGSQAPQDNFIWGVVRTTIPAGVIVQPGQSHTFEFDVTAPVLSGKYPMQWRMVQEHVAWFGEYSPALNVSVISPADYSIDLNTLLSVINLLTMD